MPQVIGRKYPKELKARFKNNHTPNRTFVQKPSGMEIEGQKMCPV